MTPRPASLSPDDKETQQLFRQAKKNASLNAKEPYHVRDISRKKRLALLNLAAQTSDSVSGRREPEGGGARNERADTINTTSRAEEVHGVRHGSLSPVRIGVLSRMFISRRAFFEERNFGATSNSAKVADKFGSPARLFGQSRPSSWPHDVAHRGRRVRWKDEVTTGLDELVRSPTDENQTDSEPCQVAEDCVHDRKVSYYNQCPDAEVEGRRLLLYWQKATAQEGWRGAEEEEDDDMDMEIIV